MRVDSGTFPRAIFFDLDGTLLAPGAVLTHETVRAVRAAAERGAAVALATGGFSERTRLLAAALHGATGSPIWAITHNGAAVWDSGGALVRCTPAPAPAINAALAAAGPRVWIAYERAAGGGTSVAYAGRLRREMIHLIWGTQPGGSANAETEGLRVGLEPRWDWRRARSVPPESQVLGCWCVGTPEALAPLDGQAAGHRLHGARYLPWSSRLGQILGRPRLRLVGRDLGAAEASKGAAAAWLCDRLGIDPAETAAFGDGNNDLELMAFAGTAVAMANATPVVQRAAHLIAPSNECDGVACVLWRWLEHGWERYVS